MRLFEAQVENALTGLDTRNLLCRVLPTDQARVTIRHPGHCWPFNGLHSIWSDGGSLKLPFKGSGLYGMQVNPQRLVKWPFAWEWSHDMAEDHTPSEPYSLDEIKQFLKAEQLEDLPALEKKIRGIARPELLIAKDLLASIKPGVRINPFGNPSEYGAVINVPIMMYRLAVGQPSDGKTSFHKASIEAGRKAIRWGSL